MKDSNNKKTLLLTGGLGYIGSHAVVAFEEAGYECIIIDNLSNTSVAVLDGISNILGYTPMFYEGDLRNTEDIDGIFRQHDIDGVIHFAALKAVGESCEKPGLYFENNINGAINLCNTMNAHGVRNLLFSSSCTVYGDPQYIPVDEHHPLGKTTNPYGKTKQLMEQVFEDYATFAGFHVINLRYFNPVGAHASGEIGENPDGTPANLCPFIFKVATGELEKLKVTGNDYPTPDGTGVRDYIDIEDLVDGHLKAYQYLAKKDPDTGVCEAINLGVGKGVSVLEMLHAVEEVVGKKLPYEIVPRRPGDIAEIYAKPDLAKELLGWEAKVPLKESLAHMWNFYHRHASHE